MIKNLIMEIKTTRKTNKTLFEQCHAAIGGNRYDVVTVLLDKWANGEIELKETNPIVENEYDYKDYFISKIKLNTFTISLSHKLGRELKDWQSINILMYNFLNQ